MIESDEDEFIVGRKLLEEHRIDVNHHLGRFAARSGVEEDEFGDPMGIPTCNAPEAGEIHTPLDGLVADGVERGAVDESVATRFRLKNGAKPYNQSAPIQP